MTEAPVDLRLERLDRRSIQLSGSEVIGCIVVRDEAARLPALLGYHRRLGIEQFFVIDNGSRDRTVAYLLAQDDVRVWSSDLPFREAKYGAAWFEAILREYATSHWVVIIDADEFLWYPDCETVVLPDLCAALDADGHRAFGAVLLDMYSDLPLVDTVLTAEVDPLAICRYFDRRWCHTATMAAGPFGNQLGLWGGVRRRVFGGEVWDYCLNKVPLLRFDADCVLVGGQHATNLELAPIRGAVLHFKFVDALASSVIDEVARGQRAAHASEYLAYREALCLDPALTMYEPTMSVRLEGSRQLVDLGIMGEIPDLDRLAHLGQASLRLAARRFALGHPHKALVHYQRAAELLPTSVVPLERLAQVCHGLGVGAEACRALDEAALRQPDDLSLLDAISAMRAMRNGRLPGPVAGSPSASELYEAPPSPGGRLDLTWCTARPRWTAALRSLAPLHGTDGARFDECVDATFGWPNELGFDRHVHSVPWIGCVHAVPDPPAHLEPFARHGLAALFEGPELRRSLTHCLGLMTFTDRAAEWLADHTDVPISVVRPPVDPPAVPFDFGRFAGQPHKRLEQRGWWMRRLNSICDLPVPRENTLGITKVRHVDPSYRQLVRGLARAQRHADGWPDDAHGLRNTIESDVDGGAACDTIVFADLYDANADEVVLACLTTATPLIVNRLPAVVEYLGREYPLYFDSLEEAARKVVDIDLISQAHEYLVASPIPVSLTGERFCSSIRSSVIYEGLS